MNIKELRARLSAIKSEMQGLIDAGLDSDAQAKFDELEAEAQTVRGQIDRLERFESTNKDDDQGQGRKTSHVKVEVRDNRQDDPKSGFENLADFALAVMAAVPQKGGMVDERLKIVGAPTNFHREGGSSDGYMVPAQMRQEIYELVFAGTDLLSMVDGEPTQSNTVQFLADETTPWGSTGVQAYWSAEASQFTPSRLETDARELKIHKLHAFVTATEELLEDAPRLNSRLTKGAARAINWKSNNSILFGSGAGMPYGFNTHGSKVTVAKESGQAADTVVAKNVAKMFSRSLNPGGSVWIVNQDVLPELMTMVLGDQPIWTPPASGFANAPGGFLFGRPVMFSNHCGTLGDETDIMFVDPLGYYLAQKQGGIKFGSSIHLYFDYDIQAFKWTFRLGGQPYLSAPVTPNKGSATRSHFVTLADRA